MISIGHTAPFFLPVVKGNQVMTVWQSYMERHFLDKGLKAPCQTFPGFCHSMVHSWPLSGQFLSSLHSIGLASDDVTKLSNAWQRGKLVLNKDSAPYKSMLGEKFSHWAKLFIPCGEVGTVLTTSSQLSVSHFKRYRGSDKCGAVFRSINDLPACFCMGRYLCLEPILPVAALWRSTCKPYCDPGHSEIVWHQNSDFIQKSPASSRQTHM